MGAMKDREIAVEDFLAVFDPEFEWEEQVMIESTGALIDVLVKVEKFGGGTVGRKYEGLWNYALYVNNGQDLRAYGRDFRTGMPHSHRYVAKVVAEIFSEGGL